MNQASPLSFLKRSAIAAAMSVSFWGIPAQAAPGGLIGSPVRVNTSNQILATGLSPSGSFLPVWESEGQLFGQLYSAAGTPSGGVFQISQSSIGRVESIRVAMDAEGDFAVVWSNQQQPRTVPAMDGTNYTSLRSRVYAAGGSPRGGEVTVATHGWNADVAMDAGGDFVIGWAQEDEVHLPPLTANQSYYDQAITLLDRRQILAQRYHADGSAWGKQLQVASPFTAPAAAGFYPAVAMNDSGAFAVAWQTVPLLGLGQPAVALRRYSAAGTAQGGDIRVETAAKGIEQLLPAMAMDAAGGIAVVWSSANNKLPYYTVSGRLFLPNGTASTTFAVSQTQTVDTQEPRIAMNSSGAFAVVWSDGCTSGNPCARLYSASAVPLTGEFALETQQPFVMPTVAEDSSGNPLMAYQVQDVSDPADSGLFVQHYQGH